MSETPDRVTVWTLQERHGPYSETFDHLDDLGEAMIEHAPQLPGLETDWTITCWECTPAQLEARWQEEAAALAAT